MSKFTDSRVTVAQQIHAEYRRSIYSGMDRDDLLYACGRLEAALDMTLRFIDERYADLTLNALAEDVRSDEENDS